MPGANLWTIAMAPVEIIDFEPRYRDDFRRLNVEWLEAGFRVEAVDDEVLGHPEEHIIDPGGLIVFARTGEDIVGTCALKHHGDGVYELTKMGVTASVQKAGIGTLLMEQVLARYRTLEATELFLETNSILAPAIKLYRRFGFVDQGRRRPGSHYERSNVYMIWNDPDSAPLAG